jgi:hypothetical protein
MPECEPSGGLQAASPLLTALLEATVKRAEEAVERAEKAAVRPKYWLVGGFLFALVGAVLAFALKDSDAAVLGVRLQPLGGVLFAVGALIIAAAAIGSIGDGKGSAASNAEGIKSIGGLIAVVVGITAVTALTIVTLTRLDNKDSAVAVTSSAFGIISAVVGAYLGIKISSDNAANADEEVKKAALGEAKKAAIAQHVAHVASSELEATRKKADEVVTQAQAAEIKDARVQAGEEAARITDPAKGGESA